MALALRAARREDEKLRDEANTQQAREEVETIIDLGDRLLDLADVRCVRFRPGFEAGTPEPATWADIEFYSGTVKSVFGPAVRRLEAVLYQDGVRVEVITAPSA